jgi:hypothetical protein
VKNIYTFFFNLPFGVVFLKTLIATTQNSKISGNIFFGYWGLNSFIKKNLTDCGMLKFELSH